MDNQHLSLLLQPLDKAYWDNAALVLSRIAYSRLEPIIPGLIEWMYDLNWPGALKVAELLCNIGTPVIPHLKDYLMDNDEQFISWLLTEIVEKWREEFVIVHLTAKRILEEHELL